MIWHYYKRDKKEIQENLSDMLKINSIFIDLVFHFLYQVIS